MSLDKLSVPGVKLVEVGVIALLILVASGFVLVNMRPLVSYFQ